MEKSKQTLEAENADLAAELKSSVSSKSELERKRKIIESQLSKYYLLLIKFCLHYIYRFNLIISYFAGEIQSKFAESERSRIELNDRLSKLSNENESIVSQLEAAELKASAAEKSAGTMETQLQETQVFKNKNYLIFCSRLIILCYFDFVLDTSRRRNQV